MIRTYVHDIMILPHEVRVDQDHESQIHDIIRLPCEARVDQDIIIAKLLENIYK